MDLFQFCVSRTAVASVSAGVSPGVVTPAGGGPGQEWRGPHQAVHEAELC